MNCRQALGRYDRQSLKNGDNPHIPPGKNQQ
jgi:hypothetical protein